MDIVGAITSPLRKVSDIANRPVGAAQRYRPLYPLNVVDRAYLMETGKMRASGTSAEMLANDDVRKAYLGI